MRTEWLTRAKAEWRRNAYRNSEGGDTNLRAVSQARFGRRLFLLTFCGRFVTITAMSRLIILTCLVCFGGINITEGATLIPTNSTWKYFKGTIEASTPTTAW